MSTPNVVHKVDTGLGKMSQNTQLVNASDSNGDAVTCSAVSTIHWMNKHPFLIFKTQRGIKASSQEHAGTYLQEIRHLWRRCTLSSATP